MRGRSRSALYVPGDRPAMLARSLERGADIVVVDLEDGVAPSQKSVARAAVAGWLAGLGPRDALPCEVWVRVNSGPELSDDVAAVSDPVLTGLCLPKASGEGLVAVDLLLSAREEQLGLPAESIGVWPLLEDAAAVLAMEQLTRAPRVVRAGLGEVDLAAGLGIELGPEESELAWPRSQLVVCSSAAGLPPPIGPVWTDLGDAEGLRRSSERLRRLGYAGRACIHPSQVTVVHEVFTPTAEQVAAARRLVEDFQVALTHGSGVIRDAQGRMVDEAVVRSARRVLRAAGIA